MKVALKKFVGAYGGRVLLFKDLPRPFQMAMVHYMAIDGEAWEVLGAVAKLAFHKHSPKVWANAISKSLDLYVEEYGKEKFGMVNIPTEVLTQAIWNSKDAQESDFKKTYGTFENYAEWYRNGPHMPKHPAKDRWPVILGGDPIQEVLQDGWHRFHCYVKQNASIIPCIYYP